MNRWTESAQAQLDEYSARVRRELERSGADADEVAEDLRRHVHEEVEAEKLPLVTAQDVSRILARIGTPVVESERSSESREKEPSPSDNGSASPLKVPGVFLLIFGVLLPFGTIVFEFLTGACAGVLFDPLPTVGHMLFTLLVPAANLGAWLALRRRDQNWRQSLGWANGAAIGIAAFYALLFVPFTPFAVIGVVVYGLGLVPLSPALALIASIVLRSHLRNEAAANGQRLPGFWRGGALAIAGLALITLPLVVTRIGLSMAASESPAESTRGVRLLRTWGQQEEFLRACYGRQPGAAEIYDWGSRIGAEEARAIYYRVTGRAFNTVPPPKLYAGRARWNVLEEEFTWDNDQGGDFVAGRVKGLSLTSSRQDGFIDPEAAIAYVEWTLEFQNVSVRQREARAQVLLPPGGVVSRLTLWIDGEEREAAFGGRSQVKTAYKSVVTQRRDPVLVTTCGPDRVLVQCFPVAPSGGKMKVRLGITAPLSLLAADTGLFRAPSFLERNFTIPEKFQHAMWLESKGVLSAGAGSLHSDGSRGINALRGDLSDRDLGTSSAVLKVKRPKGSLDTKFQDARADGGVVRQTIVERVATKPDRVVFVLDGTEGVDEAGPALATTLVGMSGTEVAILLAADGCQEILSPTKGDAAALKKAASAVRKLRARGGHDNVPALLKAWDLVSQVPNGVIVWLHGPQPMLLENGENLRQRFERRSAPPFLISLPAHAGPNRILEKLDGLPAVKSEIRIGTFAQDLDRLLKRGRGETPEFLFVREQLREATLPDSDSKDTLASHVARLWAAEEIDRLVAKRRSEEAMRVASKYQLVTPVSGAVVLETKAQYERAGLEPVAPDSVPAVPEPSSALLLLVGAGLLALRRSLSRRH